MLAVGTNKQLYIADAGVTGFSPAGGLTTVSPALTAVRNTSGTQNALVGFARGTNNVAYYHRFLASSPGWHAMGGVFSTGLSATSANPETPTARTPTATFGLGTDNRVYESDGNWTAYPPTFTAWTPVS